MAGYVLLDDEPPKTNGGYVLLDDAPPKPSMLDALKPELDYKNIAAGMVRGAGSIGSTLLAPYDMAKDALAGKGLSLESNKLRRQQIDEGLQQMVGADPESLSYKGGKLGGEIAGTAGAGGVMARGLSAIPALAKYAPVVESGGFSLGNAGTNSKLANALLRAGGGAVQGGASAGLVDPEMAPAGMAIGGAAPGVLRAVGSAGELARKATDTVSQKLMQSAIKPTLRQLETGQADRAIQTLLNDGINPTSRGVEQLGSRVDSINNEIENIIANSGATVSKQKVLDALDSARQRFGTQVDPMPDLNTIQGVADRFAVHPSIPTDSIPIQLAQQLKRGTYGVLKDKAYGQVGTAETEAQKALARGLKEEIANAESAVGPLNARESELINALKVVKRRALMDQNKNPLGLAAISPSPAGLAAFMADRSALIKSLAARSVNATGKAITPPQQLPNLMQQYGLLGAPSVLATSP